MKFCSYILLFVVFFVPSLTLAEDEPAAPALVWKPNSAEAGNLFATALLLMREREIPGLESSWGAASGLSLASCELSLKAEPFSDAADGKLADFLLCTLFMTDKTVQQLRWDLSQARAESWGVKGGPVGVSLVGEEANLIFGALQKLQQKRKDSRRLRRKETSLPGSFVVFDVVEYALSDAEADADGNATAPDLLSCSQEYFFSPGDTRPAQPAKTHCEFKL